MAKKNATTGYDGLVSWTETVVLSENGVSRCRRRGGRELSFRLGETGDVILVGGAFLFEHAEKEVQKRYRRRMLGGRLGTTSNVV